MGERTENLESALRGRIQSSYVAVVLVFGMMLGIMEVLVDIQSQIPNFEYVMVAVLLFGIIEVPRLRDIPNEGIRTLVMSLLALQAILYIQITSPDLVASAAVAALALLFISSAIVSIAVEGVHNPIQGAAGSTIKGQLPEYLVVGGIAAIALL